MNCLPGYVTIFLNHCYKLNYKFKIILSNNKPHYSLFLLILNYSSLHVAARINIHLLQMVGMQDGGMYSSMKECINIPVQEWAVYQTPIPMSTKTCGLGMRLNIVYSRGINY